MEDLLGKLNTNERGPSNNGKIIEFSQKAETSASQITNTYRPFFEIISLRYQTSGRRLLQVDTSNY